MKKSIIIFAIFLFPFLLHSQAASDSICIWQGGVDGNWGLNVVPTADKSPVIDNAGNSPLISTGVNIKDLTIKSGATLTIDANGTLTVHGTLTNSGSITVNGNVTVD